MVIETVSKVLQKSQGNVGKLLIVDDNLEILDWLRTVLEPWGLQLILLDDPQQFWITLEQSNPDLLILVVLNGVNSDAKLLPNVMFPVNLTRINSKLNRRCLYINLFFTYDYFRCRSSVS